jgi:twitching motility protein PilI
LSSSSSLQALAGRPFELLLEMERRARAAIAAREGAPAAADEWVGIGFRLAAERFVTGRGDVREVLPIPEHITRVPGAKPWLRGIANLRGQLLTIVDLRSFLGAGGASSDRQVRILVVASRDVPTGLIVDEVVGFRRFGSDDYSDNAPAGVIRCEHYLEGCYRRGSEVWPRFSLPKLLEDEQFLTAGETAKA